MLEAIGQKLTEQLEMFSNPDTKKEGITKQCAVCLDYKQVQDFEYREPSVEGSSRRSECRSCRKEKTRVRKELSLKNPRPTDNDYKCPCCFKTEKELKKYDRWKDRSVWVLDHSHKTNEFRAWLCNTCNLGIGKLGDDITIIENALKYLKRFSNE